VREACGRAVPPPALSPVRRMLAPAAPARRGGPAAARIGADLAERLAAAPVTSPTPLPRLSDASRIMLHARAAASGMRFARYVPGSGRAGRDRGHRRGRPFAARSYRSRAGGVAGKPVPRAAAGRSLRVPGGPWLEGGGSSPGFGVPGPARQGLSQAPRGSCRAVRGGCRTTAAQSAKRFNGCRCRDRMRGARPGSRAPRVPRRNRSGRVPLAGGCPGLLRNRLRRTASAVTTPFRIASRMIVTSGFGRCPFDIGALPAAAAEDRASGPGLPERRPSGPGRARGAAGRNRGGSRSGTCGKGRGHVGSVPARPRNDHEGNGRAGTGGFVREAESGRGPPARRGGGTGGSEGGAAGGASHQEGRGGRAE
jgi:hypothetical protein